MEKSIECDFPNFLKSQIQKWHSIVHIKELKKGSYMNAYMLKDSEASFYIIIVLLFRCLLEHASHLDPC